MLLLQSITPNSGYTYTRLAYYCESFPLQTICNVRDIYYQTKITHIQSEDWTFYKILHIVNLQREKIFAFAEISHHS